MTFKILRGPILLALGYFVAAALGLLLLFSQIALMWPATALLLAYLYRAKLPDWPLVLGLCWGAGIAANFAMGSGLPIPVILSLTAVDVFVDAPVGALLLRRFVDRQTMFRSLRGVAKFILLACLVPPVLGGLLGGATVAYSFGGSLVEEWFKWFASATVSVVLLVPLLLELTHDQVRSKVFGTRILELLAIVAMGLLACGLIAAFNFLGFLFLILPVLLWAAIRFEVAGVSLLSTVIAGALVSITVAGHGPFVPLRDDVISQVAFLQFYLMASYVPALICAVVLRERAAVDRMLRQAQKMEAIGQLSGGIAHDFNNILGVIRGNLELAQLTQDDAKQEERIKTAIKSVDRGASLAEKLLLIARSDFVVAETIDVNEPLRALQALLTKSLTAAVDIRFNLSEDLWQVNIDVNGFEDAVLNLALNARDAMPNGGVLVIETTNKTLDEQYAATNPGGRAGEFVLISLSDTGTGMTEEVREKAFEPFFSTKDAGSGTGLGLAMVYSFVQRSGGFAKIYSEPGVGTTIHIYLPRSYEVVATGTHESLPSQEPARGDECILVVDDEPELLSIAAGYCESLGYDVYRVANGNEALTLINQHEDISLLFSDVIMPGGMDGYELAIAAHEVRPALKILLTSGFTQNREAYLNGNREIVGLLAAGLLSKPYGRHELAAALRRLLDKKDDD
ncbi:MAG: response regulator [Rhizobiales bacterium]|nr:response regulator [Hyphomicrobiales bacterium]